MSKGVSLSGPLLLILHNLVSELVCCSRFAKVCGSRVLLSGTINLLVSRAGPRLSSTIAQACRTGCRFSGQAWRGQFELAEWVFVVSCQWPPLLFAPATGAASCWYQVTINPFIVISLLRVRISTASIPDLSLHFHRSPSVEYTVISLSVAETASIKCDPDLLIFTTNRSPRYRRVVGL